MYQIIYSGDHECGSRYKSGSKEGLKCSGRAYYFQEGNIYCGRHSKKETRKKLKNNPEKDILRQKENEVRKSKADNLAAINKQNNIKGKVIVSKLSFMSSPQYQDGYMAIFPNYKHKNRQDGLGFSKLSPKCLGPVIHNMKNLPRSKNLENFYQYSKITKDEKYADYLEVRIDAYNSDLVLKKKKKDVVNSIYFDKENQPNNFDYIQSRFFYCHYYEKLAMKTPEFAKLKDILENGYNLQIFGYDGYNIDRDIYQHYTAAKPFGHELVLYCLLMIYNKEEYPWNIYYKENQGIYNNII